MSFAPKEPYQPYAALHAETKGPDDQRPNALQIVKDLNATGKLKGKTVLITGCSAGIGIEAARALYETGAKLFLTARDVPKLQKVIEDLVSNGQNKDTPRPEALEIHLDSLQSVRAGAEEFKKRSTQLNILINNAGVMACPYGTTKDGFETQIGTNHMAHFLLFQLLKPLLLQSASKDGMASRVICVSSAGHRQGGINFSDINYAKPGSYQKWVAYGQSKTANIYMASSIERHYGSQNLRGLSLHPGEIQTELGRHLNQDDYAALGFDKWKNIMKSPAQGAATQVWAALEPHFEKGNGGRYLAECGECGPMAEGARTGSEGYSAHVYDAEAEEKLWKLSYEAVGLPVED
ncbi:hypothetical protein DOTSEDRAFT_43130 [Dothistroma septosporum NZE10]|uniref:NAD(P)-binding protein n=1 Tax=Dothistroma septosporum (strain NZE10 / CBS 128990) TaxID=675120 RepID=N1PUN4_DOTSN|nr:hypothetical protein DOTSEDRAFT_43130 [Dothistroma septosporum NZE10]